MSREDLAARQAALLAALVADGPAPAGFDPARLALEADALRAKRRRLLLRLIPAEVHEQLGADLVARIDGWIRTHARRTGTSLHDEATAFVDLLRAADLVPPSPRRRRRGRRGRGWRGVRAMRLSWRVTPGSPHPR
ncbi:hypothetical protein Acsp06_24420 [Actinomycetospora sp. NBRC 106375]|uniref:hypothetical protein n=1 Tax=Actinomycetospora sp. NBRC 106375 TaxID=3032207 RepID=UPI0024A3B832|nr:hypothetical protein [Actinomycetospora sp. NBRC 106375]GLZ46257.1 hypothetical protein Acsp06_24420 [Actinomycetospora sp. NBRC 106375]